MSLLALVAAVTTLAVDAGAPAPKLGVMIVVDQFGSADLESLTQLGERDFGGLRARGAAHFDAWYDTLATETGPGHATLATGAGPSVNGICANEWYENNKPVYCVDDANVKVIGAPDAKGKSARALAAPTLADALKAHSPSSKVIALSGKDRAALFMAGNAGDLALWYEPSQQKFTSSTAYVQDLPAWAAKLADLPKRVLETATWSPLDGGVARTLADARPGEGTPEGFTQTFPHDLKAVPEKNRAKAYRFTPTSIEHLFQLANAAIDEEKLGKRGVADLLYVSISATDYAGHVWGPDSVEKVDLLERTSQQVKQFTADLDKKLGRDGWVLVVSADHGAAPLPEPAMAAHVVGGRVGGNAFLAAVKQHVDAKWQARVLAAGPPHIYLDESGLEPSAQERLRAQALAGALSVPGVVPASEALAARSSFGTRCGVVTFDLAPYFVFTEAAYTTGTDHSSGNAYDRRVPLFVLGPTVTPGRRVEPVRAVDAAPTLGAMLGIPPPERAEGRPVAR